MASGAFVFYVSDPGVGLLASLGVALAAVALLWPSEGTEHQVRALLQAVLAYACVKLLWAYSGTVWYAMEGVARATSAVGSVATNTALDVGASGGVWLVLLVSLYALAASSAAPASLRAGRAGMAACMAFAGLLLAWGLVVAFSYGMIALPLGWAPTLDTAQGLVFLCLVPAVLLASSWRWDGASAHPAGQWSWAGVALLGLGAGLLVAPPAARVGSREVGIYTKGFMDLKTPSHSAYGQERTGMFGCLPTYLEALDYPTRLVHGPVEAKALDKLGALVIINLTEPLAEQEAEAVWDFVARGGGLLVMGDHTDVYGVARATTALTQRVGIDLAFDSAMPHGLTWDRALEVLPHAVNAGIVMPPCAGVKIGASLDVRPPSRPVLLGRYAWRDGGDRLNVARALLGDYAQDALERAGDVVLAAAATHRRGKVLVFGDTSTFQNPGLLRTYPYIATIMEWLTSRDEASLVRGNLLAAGMLLFGALGLLCRRAAPRAPLVASLLAVSVLWHAGMGARELRSGARPNLPPSRVAIIDAVHGNLYSNDTGTTRSMSGLGQALWREGFVAFTACPGNDLVLSCASVYVVVAPSRPYRPPEVKQVRSWVEAGGHLVVATGWEEEVPASELLRAFGCRIGDVPLATAQGSWPGGSAVSNEAWPVLFADGGEPLLTYKGYALVAERRVGKGTVTVIGDSTFLQTGHLEDYKRPNLPKIKFVSHLLSRWSSGALPRPERAENASQAHTEGGA